MDTDKVSLNDYEDIRPLNPDEVEGAIEELVTSADFERAFRYVKPNVDWDDFSAKMRACKTKEQFKSTLAYDFVMEVARQTTF